MSIPATQGQYGFADIYARSNRAMSYVFSVPDGSGVAVNVNAYSALRLNVADSQNNVVIHLNTNASGLIVINTNHVTINATATQLNVTPAVYSFDMDGLSAIGWQPVASGRFRIDRSV